MLYPRRDCAILDDDSLANDSLAASHFKLLRCSDLIRKIDENSLQNKLSDDILVLRCEVDAAFSKWFIITGTAP